MKKSIINASLIALCYGGNLTLIEDTGDFYASSGGLESGWHWGITKAHADEDCTDQTDPSCDQFEHFPVVGQPEPEPYIPAPVAPGNPGDQGDDGGDHGGGNSNQGSNEEEAERERKEQCRLDADAKFAECEKKHQLQHTNRMLECSDKLETNITIGIGSGGVNIGSNTYQICKDLADTIRDSGFAFCRSDRATTLATTCR